MSNPSQSATVTTPSPTAPTTSRSLVLRVVLRFPLLFLAAAAVLFLPAGTWRYWQGWALLAAYFLSAISGFTFFLISDPEVVNRRLESKEPISQQEQIMRWFKPAFFLAFLIPGFDHRLGWSRNLLGPVPPWLTVLALLLVVLGFVFVFWVIRVNRFAARTIRVEAGQEVISSGPYRFVRHPMYTGSLILFLFSPLALGSYVALPFFALLVPFYVLRLLNEEKLLRAELPGYSEYCQSTRSRLIPLIW